MDAHRKFVPVPRVGAPLRSSPPPTLRRPSGNGAFLYPLSHECGVVLKPRAPFAAIGRKQALGNQPDHTALKGRSKMPAITSPLQGLNGDMRSQGYALACGQRSALGFNTTPRSGLKMHANRILAPWGDVWQSGGTATECRWRFWGRLGIDRCIRSQSLFSALKERLLSAKGKRKAKGLSAALEPGVEKSRSSVGAA